MVGGFLVTCVSATTVATAFSRRLWSRPLFFFSLLLLAGGALAVGLTLATTFGWYGVATGSLASISGLASMARLRFLRKVYER